MNCPSQTSEAKAVRLCEALASSPFWVSRFSNPSTPRPNCKNDLLCTPAITKVEIVAEQFRNPPLGSFANRPVTRLHQSSGTVSTPLAWGDSTEDWGRILDIWDLLFRIAEIKDTDKLLFPFSFGPFLGFWSAFEAATRSGRFCLAAGGLSTQARIRLIERHQITVVLTTPSYAQHMAEAAGEMGIDLKSLPVRALILAGEPGANRPALRNRLETAWEARVFDHHGMTETGPVSMECARNPGVLHIADESYLAQVLEPNSDNEVDEGELVLTPMDRLAMPLIRYRTGDRVKVYRQPCPCGRPLLSLAGGILGRLDDMLIIRGNNIHPEAIENWLWSHPEIKEFRIEVKESSGLSKLKLVIDTIEKSGKDTDTILDRLHSGFQERFLFQAEVEISTQPLERFEMKARRLKKL